jgi:hypothetical protein
LSTSATYAAGTQVTMTGLFKDVNGALVDPTTVSAKISLPSGAIVDLTSSVVKNSIGNYSAVYTPVVAGGFNYQMQGTGNCAVAAYGAFNVAEPF